MAPGQDRLAQIFIWRHAGAPDIEYARQVLSVVNPDALRVFASEDPPLRLFSIFGPWPSDPWARAIPDMRVFPAPDGTHWTDTTRYDLAGWQGRDSRTGDQLFIVTAYRKANAPASETFEASPAPAPSFTHPKTAVPQVPYNPQRPTGPVAWPPSEITTGSHTGTGRLTNQLNTSSLSYYALGYITGPMGNIVPPEPSHESYTPYYAGFPQRLLAGLIDLACVTVIEVAALMLYNWSAGNPNPKDIGEWVGAYWAFAVIAVLILAAYHVLQWTFWGQTIGKSLLGIKVVDRNGQKPQFGRAVLRMTGYLPSMLFVGIGGFLLIVFDTKRQALHDKIAETYVVPDNPPSQVPVGMPGYSSAMPETVSSQPEVSGSGALPAVGLANVAGPQSYEVVQFSPEQTSQETPPRTEEDKKVFREIASLDENMKTVVVLPELPEEPPVSSTPALTASGDLPTVGTTGALNEQMLRQRTDRTTHMERARDLFRQGMSIIEQGVQQTEYGYKVDSLTAHRAAQLFQSATELVPNSVVYRYFLGVALRYAEGFEVAIREFRQVLELDPNHYEARQQVGYGQRWHDAFAYQSWADMAATTPGTQVPPSIGVLLPANRQPMTRLVILREGSSKVVSVLSRTPRNSWSKPLTDQLPAHVSLVLSRTPSGPIIAFYVVVNDRPGDPYKGETFLNPHDPDSPNFDACQLGQNLLSQMHRQDHTYLIFVDEDNRLIFSRRLDFDPQTQVNINDCLYEVQTLPAQIMDPQRFQQAAEWHMEHFSLDQVK